MNCICLVRPEPATTLGYVFGDDGIVWLYGHTCPIHHEPAVSPIWHPAIGWLAPERNNEPITAATGSALIEAL